jgi:hypothetical protein
LARQGPGVSQRVGPNTFTVSPGTSSNALKFRQNFKALAKPLSSVDAPIAVGMELSSPLTKMEPEIKPSKLGMVLRGTEYIAQIVLPQASSGQLNVIPQGGCVFSMPINPLYVEGLRVAEIVKTFTLFRIRKLVIEYVPVCPSTTEGALIAAFIQEIDHNPSLASGSAGLRDLSSRAGSSAWNVWSHGAVEFHFPQQKWYFTSGGDVSEPVLAIPGQLFIQTATTLSRDDTANLALGFLWMHYELEVQAPSMPDPATLVMSAAFTTINFAGISTLSRTPFSLNATGFVPLPPGYVDYGQIGSFIVVAADDSGPGNANWRTWISPKTGDIITISEGMTIWFRRVFNSAGTNPVYFYPDLGAAFEGSTDGDAPSCFLANYTVGPPPLPATAGFKCIQLMGFQLPGDQ